MSTFVYIIVRKGAPFVKIGMSDGPSIRMASIQTGIPELLELAHSREFDSRAEAFAAETEMHCAFSSKRIRGEWFDIPQSVAVSALQNLSLPEVIGNPSFCEYCKFAGSTEKAAGKLGVSIHTASAYRRGIRHVPPEVAEAIEQDTNGKINRVSLVWPKKAAA